MGGTRWLALGSVALCGCTIANPAFDLADGGGDGGDDGVTSTTGQADGPTTTIDPSDGTSASTGRPIDVPRCDELERREVELLPQADTFLRIDEFPMCDVDGTMQNLLEVPCGDVDFGETTKYFIGGTVSSTDSVYLVRFSLLDLPPPPAVIESAVFQFEIDIPQGAPHDVSVGAAPRDGGVWMSGPLDRLPATDGAATAHNIAHPNVPWPAGEMPQPDTEIVGEMAAQPGVTRMFFTLSPDTLAQFVDLPSTSIGFIVGSNGPPFDVFLSAKGAGDPPRLLLTLCQP